MDTARKRVLEKYDLTPEARLSGGMEAEVYAYGHDAVLKLYAGTATLADLIVLRDFYDRLDRRRVPYALPRIHQVIEEEGLLITVEQRLNGARLSAALPALTHGQLELVMQRYLTAALALARIEAPPALDHYKLLDPEGLSTRVEGDWHQFLRRILAHRLIRVERYLERDVPHFFARVPRLLEVLDQPYQGDYRLIHGDFYPGNLLVDDQYQVTALMDFGLLTMYGDHAFDLATGWVFFDMYDELKARIRERYLAMLLESLGEQLRGRLYRYVLIYSILSANTYSPACADGHYRWCAANLANPEYWHGLA